MKTIQPKCEKVKCLYAQLQFRKVVLGQPFADSGVFNKTKNGKKLFGGAVEKQCYKLI